MGISGAIAAAATAIVGTVNVANLGEPYWPATRGHLQLKLVQYEREMQTAIKDATSRQINIEVRIEESERRRIKSKIDELKLELEKNQGASSNLKRIINDQIETHEGELEQKEEVIKNLRRLQFQKTTP